MKKYIILLIIPLLFFSTGCNDDDNNDNNEYKIPVSEYPESILGHWIYESREETTITQNIEIDPVYGTETVTTEQEDDITIFNPAQGFYFQWEVPIRTFKYDGTYDWTIFESDSLGNVFDQAGLNMLGGGYGVVGENIIWDNGAETRIDYLSNQRLQFKSEYIDTIMLNQFIYPNSNPGDYMVTQTIVNYSYSKLDELPFESTESNDARNSPIDWYYQ